MKLKPAPIIKMLGVTIIVALTIVLINTTVSSLQNYENITRGSSWILAALVHVPQFLIPFLLIYYLTKGNLGEYGFNLKESPPTFTHGRMFGIGALFGLLMSLKYIPQIIEKTPLDIPQPVTLVNIVGTMTFQWIIVGLCEETMFRGLIQTYLMNNLEGWVKITGHDFHIGTVIGAILWGAFHFINILIMPLGSVVFTVVLTTVAGLLMGYAYQETRSLLTTIIIHNTLFGVPLTIGYILFYLL